MAKLLADGQSTWKEDTGASLSRLAQAQAAQAAQMIRKQKLGEEAAKEGEIGVAGNITDELEEAAKAAAEAAEQAERAAAGGGEKGGAKVADQIEDASANEIVATPGHKEKDSKKEKELSTTAKKKGEDVEATDGGADKLTTALAKVKEAEKETTPKKGNANKEKAEKQKAEEAAEEEQGKEEETEKEPELGPKQMESLVRQFLDEDGYAKLVIGQQRWREFCFHFFFPFFVSPASTLSTKKALSMHIWDFGGQEIFYSLHHLFLSRYGIYLGRCIFPVLLDLSPHLFNSRNICIFLCLFM